MLFLEPLALSQIVSLMTISVVIPVYNVEKYIRRCLESVIDQENDRYKIECLIVDDCSLDSRMTLLRIIMELP